MGFSDILKTFKKPPETGGILAKMDRYLIALDGKPLLGESDHRAKDVFHPSEVSTNQCIRSMVYGWLKTPPSNPRKIPPNVKRIFDVGHHKGYILQQYFWDMDILEGNYHCVECKHDWWAVSPRKCPNCEVKSVIWYNLRYDEINIRSERWNITGHADGIIIQDGKRILLEFKSIKNRDAKTGENAVTFDDLNQPKIEHMYQSNMYMDACDEAGLEIERGIVIYFAKNNQLMKEFPIRKMDMFLQPSYDKINGTNHALDHGYLPERAGRMKSDPICMYCAHKNLCWTTEHTFAEVDHRPKELVEVGASEHNNENA